MNQTISILERVGSDKRARCHQKTSLVCAVTQRAPSISAVGQPLRASTTNSARTEAANSFRPDPTSKPPTSGQPDAGHGNGLGIARELGRFFFKRPCNTDAAPDLAGFHNSRSFRNDELTGKPLMMQLQLPPKPAHFFFCPRHSFHQRHAENSRGLRLVWLLGINGGLV